MNVETIAAIAAALVVGGPVLVNLITSLRTKHEVDNVQRMVNGQSSEMMRQLQKLKDEVAALKLERRAASAARGEGWEQPAGSRGRVAGAADDSRDDLEHEVEPADPPDEWR